MDETGALTAEPGARASAPQESCPRCGSGAPALPPLKTPLFAGFEARRCRRCGTTWGILEGQARVLGCCRRCGVPVGAGSAAPPPERCEACGSPADVHDRPEEGIAAATLLEIKLGLSRRARFVTAPHLDTYLERIARRVAGAIRGAPTAPRIALIDDDAWRSLAFPDGCVVLSTGLLQAVDDEAELAFVLGREISHATSGAALRSLLRIGLASMAQAAGGAGEGWGDAAFECLRLGRGIDCELEADRVAFAALGGLGYDPESAVRGIERLGQDIETGEERRADAAFALPTPAERVRALTRARESLAASGQTGRTNREPFRRVVRRGGAAYVALDGATALDVRVEPQAPAAGRGRRWLVAAVTVALIAVAAAVLYLAAG